jgi:hypothetical protein
VQARAARRRRRLHLVDQRRRVADHARRALPQTLEVLRTRPWMADLRERGAEDSYLFSVNRYCFLAVAEALET